MLASCTALIFTLACCDSGTEPVRGEVARLIWNTEGGGQIQFEVTKADSAYAVRLLRVRYIACDTLLLLTSSSGAPYRATDDVFSGRTTLRSHDWAPGVIAGTWTTITLVDARGRSETLKANPAWDYPLSSICEWIGLPCGTK